jgi:DNA-binding MarR family transcriptional regulator
MAKRRNNLPPTPGELDQMIHERLRLGIVCTLAVHDALTFTELRDMLQTTDGNLSVQARKLEEAGYVNCVKNFEGRKPKTTYKLTARGRTALDSYLEVLSEMLPAPAHRLKSAQARGSLRSLTAES